MTDNLFSKVMMQPSINTETLEEYYQALVWYQNEPKLLDIRVRGNRQIEKCAKALRGVKAKYLYEARPILAQIRNRYDETDLIFKPNT